MKVLDFPARIDPADPKVAAGLSRLIDDLDLFDAIIGPLDAAVAQTTTRSRPPPSGTSLLGLSSSTTTCSRSVPSWKMSFFHGWPGAGRRRRRKRS